MSLLTVTLLVILLVLVSYFYSKWRHARNTFLDKIKVIPGPTQLFLLGNSLDFKNCIDILPKLMQYQEQYGLTFKLQFGGNDYVITADPDMIECILTSSEQINKNSIYKVMANWIGDGLICAENPRWQQHRRIIVPTFHTSVLKDFIPTFQKNTENLIKHWQNTINNYEQELDVCQDIVACTLDSICETTMGIPINALCNKNQSNYLKAINFMGHTIVEKSFSVWKRFDTLYKLSASFRQEIAHLACVRQVTDDVIKQKRSEVQNTNNNSVNKRKAFLDHWLEVKKQNGCDLTDEELRDEVQTIIFAGHDTTASSTSFTLYLLSIHPEIQDKVYNEVISIIGNINNEIADITYEKLQKLKYLDMVIKESLRLYPQASLYFRKLTEDVVYNGILLPKDLNLGVFAYGAHRNAAIFKNPDVFDPERFTVANTRSRSIFAYVPFSAGPRNCVGKKFAILEMKCMLSCLLREFKFTKPANFEIQPSAEGALKSINGVRLIIQPRNKESII